MTVLCCGLVVIDEEVGLSSKMNLPLAADAQARRGVQYRVHHIEGLRVLEVVVGPGDFNAPMPVVLQIHGRGDRARLPEGSFTHLREPMRIIIPEASKRMGFGFSWAPVSVRAHRPAVLGAALTIQADRIHRVLQTITKMRPVVGKPLVTGFSQGGMLTFVLALRHPDSFCAAVPMAGFVPAHLIPGPADAAHRIPIRALHGAADPTVVLSATQVAVRRLQHLGYDVTLEEFEGVEHEVSKEMRARYRELLHAIFRSFEHRDERRGPSV